MEGANSDNHHKLLIVDDDASVRDLLKKTLERNSYSCWMASNAVEARGFLKRDLFDLILCDIRMPGESGLDLCRFVKSEYPDTAIVMVTVIDDLKTAREALSMDIYGYIIKPVDTNQILISVANALRRRELEIITKTYQKNLEKKIHEKTAELLKSNKMLRNRESKLSKQTKQLGELNIALNVLLKKMEEDKAALKDQFVTSIKKTIIPYLEKIKRGPLSQMQQRDLELLESNIKDIVSPFVKEISSSFFGLTPNEIQVANLIKQGKTTKEIAAILNLSENTIMTHRFKIRTKLGLKNKKRNLHFYLNTLQQQ